MQPILDLQTIRPLLERMAPAVWAVARECVTPIAVVHADRTHQWGTGTLFRVADQCFMVTAAHVWQEAERANLDGHLCLFSYEASGDSRPVSFGGRMHLLSDPHDVAVLALEASVVADLGDRRFLRLSDVAFRPHPRGLLWVYGFPQETAVRSPGDSELRFQPLWCLLPRVGGDTTLENFDPRFHFLLNAARESLVDRDGIPAEMPRRLRGISGCSIWQPEWPADNDPESWKPDGTRIVGVETSLYPGPSFIKATCWEAIVHVLHVACPDLRKVLQLHFGTEYFAP
jgi:hypothetical protein